MSTNIYNWFEEPENVRIKLESSIRNKILKQAIAKADSVYKLTELIGCCPQTVYNYLNGVSMRVGSLRKLLDLLNIPYSRITNSILEISWFKKPNLPFKLNSNSGAILIGAFLSDGSNTSRVMYKNKEKVMLKKVEKALKDLFGKHILIDRRISDEGIPYILTSEIVSRVLNKFGIPEGKKIKLNLPLPTVISKGNKKIKVTYLRQVFDDEGDVTVTTRTVNLTRCLDITELLNQNFIKTLEFRKQVSVSKIPLGLKALLKKNPPKLLIDESNILKDLGIGNKIRLRKIVRQVPGYVIAVWILSISDKKNILKFKKTIDFTIFHKLIVLDKLLNSYVKKRFFNNKIYDKIISVAKRELERKNYFTTRELVLSTKLSYNSVMKRLDKLRRLKRVTVLQPTKYALK